MYLYSTIVIGLKVYLFSSCNGPLFHCLTPYCNRFILNLYIFYTLATCKRILFNQFCLEFSINSLEIIMVIYNSSYENEWNGNSSKTIATRSSKKKISSLYSGHHPFNYFQFNFKLFF